MQHEPVVCLCSCDHYQTPFHCDIQGPSLCWPESGNTHIFSILGQVKNWAGLTVFHRGERTLWVASLLTWGHPKKSTKSFPEQRITRIFQDKSYHKYLWEPDILLFNETWNWMNEWSFQRSHSFSSNSEADYFKYWHSFNVMLILYRLKSTEICRIILNLCWHKQL